MFIAPSGKPLAFLTVCIIVLPGLYSCLNNQPEGQWQGERQRDREGENALVAKPLENQMMSLVSQRKN